jgi:hypothetical protein
MKKVFTLLAPLVFAIILQACNPKIQARFNKNEQKPQVSVGKSESTVQVLDTDLKILDNELEVSNNLPLQYSTTSNDYPNDLTLSSSTIESSNIDIDNSTSRKIVN